ncbi:hypothetical protein BDZ97DRAFT_1913646 [Flammula alnicola]|nr:hypothetical protein BDZ97DRAFT_1913646 [Flammula alnicola]
MATTTATPTPSKNKSASRSQSQSLPHLVEELQDELAVDVTNSTECDLDQLLRTFLFSILKDDSQTKKQLVDIQNRIEHLERQLDTRIRTLDAEKKEAGVKHAKGKAESGPPGEVSNEGDSEIKGWKKELEEQQGIRQDILDTPFNECLDALLPICEDPELREELQDFTRSKEEDDMYAPFARAGNRAFDLLSMNREQLSKFQDPSPLNCCFHQNDPKTIKTKYEDSTIFTKPDVSITSRIAAGDARVESNPTMPTAYDKPPDVTFEMGQVLCSCELKYGKAKMALFSKYINGMRQTPNSCQDPVVLTPYPIVKNTPAVKAIDRKQQAVEGEEPPAKRVKVDSTEPVASSSNIATSSSNVPSSGNAPSSSNTGKTSDRKRMKGKGSESKQATASAPNEETITQPPNNSQRMIDARTQCAVYGMEMLSYTLGVHHAITLLIIDSKLWIWYYDRQGILQSDGIDFLKDLLVLLFAFQRFNLRDWGVVVESNPSAVLAHNPTPAPTSTRPLRAASAKSTARNDGKKETSTFIFRVQDLDPDSLGNPKEFSQIEINLKDPLSNKAHHVGGRATNVLGSCIPINPEHADLACKISFPEVVRQNEGKLIQDLRKELREGDEQSQKMLKHLPDVLLYGDMPLYGTQRMRSMLKVPIEGYRILRLVLFKKMFALTSLTGKPFVKAWLEVVKMHAYLWNLGIEHGDPSLWNTMYNKDEQCGVLSDYDLAIARRQLRVLGTDRTGTIPFMSIDLLDVDYWNGKIERQYAHEQEALIWILPFVFLRFQDTKVQKGSPVDQWMTSDYVACQAAKSVFIQNRKMERNGEFCKADWKPHWKLAKKLLSWVKDVASFWPKFVEKLREASLDYPDELQYIEDLITELELDTVLGPLVSGSMV